MSKQVLRLSSGTSSAAAPIPRAIAAQGEARREHTKVIVIGAVLGLLLIGGFAAWFVKPGDPKDIWLIIGPTVSATLGYLAGKKSSDEP